MLSDIYIIVITAFAIFGAFCLAEQMIIALKYSDLPQSITVLKWDSSCSMTYAVGYIHNALYNNQTVIVSDNPMHICTAADTVPPDELSQYITNALFTNTDN